MCLSYRMNVRFNKLLPGPCGPTMASSDEAAGPRRTRIGPNGRLAGRRLKAAWWITSKATGAPVVGRLNCLGQMRTLRCLINVLKAKPFVQAMPTCKVIQPVPRRLLARKVCSNFALKYFRQRSGQNKRSTSVRRRERGGKRQAGSKLSWRLPPLDARVPLPSSNYTTR